MNEILDAEDNELEVEENTRIAYKNSIKGILSLVIAGAIVIIITLISPVYNLWASPVIVICFFYALGCALPGTIYSIKSILVKEKNTFKKIFAIIYNGLIISSILLIILSNVMESFDLF